MGLKGSQGGNKEVRTTMTRGHNWLMDSSLEASMPAIEGQRGPSSSSAGVNIGQVMSGLVMFIITSISHPQSTHRCHLSQGTTFPDSFANRFGQ